MTLINGSGKNTSPSSDPAAGKVAVVAEAGNGRTAVRLQLLPQGRDWLLLITGGDAHVGAVAAADAHGCQLAVLPPHKEGPLARECAQAVARQTGCSCAAVAGIHQDNATAEEIAAIVQNVRSALADILAEVASPGPSTPPNDEEPQHG